MYNARPFIKPKVYHGSQAKNTACQEEAACIHRNLPIYRRTPVVRSIISRPVSAVSRVCPAPGISLWVTSLAASLNMALIEFSKEEKSAIVDKIQRYFQDELGQDIGQFDSEFLLDFFSEQVGSYYYNRGLYDARSILEGRLEDISEAIYEIEKPTDYSR
jgi:uncharacterized protein (DUF2164 family)